MRLLNIIKVVKLCLSTLPFVDGEDPKIYKCLIDQYSLVCLQLTEVLSKKL